jgi:diacylglycerol kinase (ATP)
MKHIFIVNPTSGTQQSPQLIPLIERYFAAHEDAFEIMQTNAAGHAKRLAEACTTPGDVLYVLGGDGTANEVLNGLQAGVHMAILPSGTGNDFYRMLKLPPLSLEEVLIQTIEGKNVKVDYAMADQQRFINCFSMGFDADIGLLADRIKKQRPWLSPLAYGIAIVMKLLNRKNQPMRLIFNDRVLQTNSLMIAVMNGQYYGGGFMPTPEASIQDGVLDVCVVENTNLLNVLRVLPKYLKGTHTREKIVQFFKVTSLRLESASILNGQTDGEGLSVQTIDFKIIAHGLSLRVPHISGLQST